MTQRATAILQDLSPGHHGDPSSIQPDVNVEEVQGQVEHLSERLW